jgi:hypothetical protein
MGLTKFPYGVSSFGVPVFGSGQIPTTTGDYYFVSSVATNDSIAGVDQPDYGTMDKPFATINYAISKCTASNGDIIVVGPGHAETITATSTAISTSGVQIIGLGNGLLRPTFTFGAAAATITVSAANCSIVNCVFVANFADVAAAFTLAAAKDFRIQNNLFTDTSAILNFLNIVVTNATNNTADGLVYSGNQRDGLATGGIADVSVLGNLDRLQICDNVSVCASTANVGHMLTMSSKVVTNAQILRNYVHVVGAVTASQSIFMTGSSTTNTGICAFNLSGSLCATTPLFCTATLTFRLFENYYNGTVTGSGTLLPAAA